MEDKYFLIHYLHSPQRAKMYRHKILNIQKVTIAVLRVLGDTISPSILFFGFHKVMAVASGYSDFRCL